jgi:hypothetical protein
MILYFIKNQSLKLEITCFVSLIFNWFHHHHHCDYNEFDKKITNVGISILS